MKAVLAVVDGAELGGQGQPGGEKLGWRNQKEPQGQAVASRMRGPVGEKRGNDCTCRKLGYLDECASPEKHFLKKPVFGALNYKICPTQALQTPMPPFSFSQNSTIHWLKSCREKGNKGWFLLYNNLVPVGTVSTLEGLWVWSGVKDSQTHLFGPQQCVSRVSM